MRQATLKIHRYARGAQIVNNDNLQVRFLRAIVFSFGILAICYLFILGNMVFNIVQRKSLEADARNLSTDVGDMELSYLSLLNKVDISLGHSLGFKEAKTTFATRKSLGALDHVKVAQNDL